MTTDRFPGRWLGGVAGVLAPLLLLAGILLRAGPNFFFPDQLAADAAHPVRMGIAYSLVLAGTVLLWPPVVALAQRITTRHPVLGVWGGALACSGLFARTFHAGLDHLAFQLVRLDGPASATRTMAATYGAYHIMSALTPAIMVGWVVLAAGAWRARVLSRVGCLALAATSVLPIGVLKGTTVGSVVAAVGLAGALVPFGVAVLTSGAWPGWPRVVGWSGVVIAVMTVMTVLGTLG